MNPFKRFLAQELTQANLTHATQERLHWMHEHGDLMEEMFWRRAVELYEDRIRELEPQFVPISQNPPTHTTLP